MKMECWTGRNLEFLLFQCVNSVITYRFLDKVKIIFFIIFWKRKKKRLRNPFSLPTLPLFFLNNNHIKSIDWNLLLLNLVSVE